MQYKLRKIMHSTCKPQDVYGITIPYEVAQFFQEVFFTIEKDGQTITLKSGCCLSLEKRNVVSYEFDDARIKEVGNGVQKRT